MSKYTSEEDDSFVDLQSPDGKLALMNDYSPLLETQYSAMTRKGAQTAVMGG